jgi:restriction endonuclease S subunit
MGGFKFSRETNVENVFLVNLAELQNRLDPLFYKTVHSFSLVKNTIYNVKKLSEVVTMQRGRFGHRPRNDPKFYGGKYPFMQTGDVVKASQTNEPISYTQTLNELGLKTSRLFDKRVLVITIAANIGDTAILDFPACFPDSLIGMTPKDEILTLEYLNVYFKFLKPYLEDLAPQAAQKNINYQQLSPVPIVLPPLSIQEKIALLFRDSHKRKQQKEKKAQTLLDGIDEYLINELGITLPEQDNRLEKRMFTVRFSESTSGRIDPYYFQEHFVHFFKLLEKSKYQVLPLSKISQRITSGITPISGGDAYTTADNGIPFIRSGNININGDIDFSDLLYLRPSIHNGVMKSSKLNKSDLMIAIVGATIGQVGIYIDDREANINQAIALVRLNAGINHNYVKELIKSGIGQMSLNRLKRPVARANINLEEISTMQIILPPIEKQNEIATHISNIRAQAKQLQTEAAQILSDAKARIEHLILGDAA